MVKQDETYSFHLSSADESFYSDTGSMTSSYKERIDSLFRSKRNHGNQKSLVTTVQVHCSPAPKNIPSAIQHRSIVTATHTAAVTNHTSFESKIHQASTVHTSSPIITKVQSSTVHTSPIITTNHSPTITSIHVPPPQAWKAKGLTPKEELETIFGGKDQRKQAFQEVRTAVQAKIEKLFSEPIADSSKPGVRSIAPNLKSPLSDLVPPLLPIPGEQSPPPLPKNPPPPVPKQPPPQFPPHSTSPSPSVTPSSDHVSLNSSYSSIVSSPQVTVRKVSANMRYSIDYLGATQLSDKATSLEVLQEPLKELYYKYRYSISKGKKAVPGELRITDSGIRIVHGVKNTPGYYELLNPFPTIAVWAAVKLVIRREVGEHGQMFFSYAFLPLICDPEAQDKYNLYHELNVGAPNVMAGEHPPMFACVMRKVGVPKILECHGFVCRSSEDAIVIAANLYQSLLESMKSGHSSDYSDVRDDDRNVLSDSEIIPIRPPRRKRNSELSGSRRLRRSSSEDMLRSSSRGNRVSKRRIKRSISNRHSFTSMDDMELYTKVSIPRSKSFINVTNKYDFQDLLDDVKKKTGLNSVDDVLKQIINPNGMSFSEMNPNYREVLLKLALTLSKDEIYQRSKNIMKKQKLRHSSTSIFDSDSEGSTISSVLRATKRSFSRFGSKASSLQPPSLKDKSSSKKTQIKNKYNKEHMAKIAEIKFAEDFNKITVANTNKRVAPKTPMPKRAALARSSDGYGSCSECGYESECSSKCYCSLPRDQSKVSRSSTLPTNKVLHRAKNSSHRPLDAFCECDTESCAESEKCYCSLKSIKKNGLKMYEINLDSETNTDTDVTVRSVGSYNSRGYGSQTSSSNRHRNSSPYLTENSKARSAGTVFSLHPDDICRKSKSSHFSSDSDGSGHQHRSRSSSTSQKLPYQRYRSASTDFLIEKPRLRRHPSGSLGSGGSQDSNSSHRSSIGSLIDEGSPHSRSSTNSNQKILLVSAVDPSGKVVYRGASKQNRREGSDTNSILSMKKTAEIAALFSDLKLNQTTDLIQHLDQSTSDSEDDAYSSMQANNSFLFSDNIENSLGYLP